jgi:hypothetical protein
VGSPGREAEGRRGILAGRAVPDFDLAGVGLPAGTVLGLGTGLIDRPTADYTRLAMNLSVYAPKGTRGVDPSTCTGTALGPNLCAEVSAPSSPPGSRW